MSVLSLLDPAVLALHQVVVALASTLPWPHQGAALAVSLALVTIGVRTALLPVAVRTLRTERARSAIAPDLEALRRRHRDDPRRLLAETARVQREAGVGPLAGLLPALAQLPVIMSIYRLVVLPVIAGHPNLVLAAHLFGAPLAAHWPEVIAAGGLIGPGALALLSGLLLLIALATLSSRDVARRAGPIGAADTGTTRADASVVAAGLLRWMPYGTVVVAAFAPVAVGVYLLTSTTWTVAERRLLPRIVRVGSVG